MYNCDAYLNPVYQLPKYIVFARFCTITGLVSNFAAICLLFVSRSLKRPVKKKLLTRIAAGLLIFCKFSLKIHDFSPSKSTFPQQNDRYLSWVYVSYSNDDNCSSDFSTMEIWSFQKSDACTRSAQSWRMGSRYCGLYFWNLRLSWMGLLGRVFSPRQLHGVETDICW